MSDFKKGDIVLYKPSDLPGQPAFGAVVKTESWELGHGAVVCHLKGLGKAYDDFTGKRGRTTVSAALVDRLKPAPTYYHVATKSWLISNDGDCAGHIYWHDAPSLQDNGWKYSLRDAEDWTHGIHAESYEAARAKVEELCE